MSYVEKNLMPSEVIIYRTRLHWAVYLLPAVVALMSLLVCFAGKDAIVFGVLLFSSLVLPMMIDAFVKTKTSEFAVTNKRVIMKVGFIRRSSVEVLLTKVEGISVDQGIFGRMLGFGTIVVGGTGGSKTPFHKIDDPMQFRRVVQEQIEKSSAKQ